MDWTADLALIADAARQAAEVALGFFGQSPQVWWKNEGASPVSAADFAANEVLERVLRQARPHYGWLSEETEDSTGRLSHDTVFIVDPIDGTRAFIAGQQTWCVSVAVVSRGRPVAGVLNAPALGEEFTATAEGLPRLNGEPIRVAAKPVAERRRISAAEEIVKTMSPAFAGGLERVKHVPSLAYRLAMVAAGRIDATVVKPGSHDWDLAAADLILERAGGGLVDLSGARLVYNRADVNQALLCAAGEGDLAACLNGLAQVAKS